MLDAIPLYACEEAFEGEFRDHNDGVLPIRV
jgi:hypothetical protein